ncbi:hypothetical protein J6590_089975 [Homalodisca vitripennis]|nr:hypothetical protein J6590_089975 [Homalodisca vitripennis]
MKNANSHAFLRYSCPDGRCVAPCRLEMAHNPGVMAGGDFIVGRSITPGYGTV